MPMFKWFKRLKVQKEAKKTIKELGNDFNALWEADLDSIWTITDKNQFLIAMDGWLCRKCDFGEAIEKLSEAERVFYLNAKLETEVNNGGFSQFFYNTNGDFTKEIENALCTIGAHHTASIYKKSLLALEGTLPKGQHVREALCDELLTDSLDKLFNECDDEFYKYVDDLQELNYQYIINNKEQFT